MNKEIIDAYDYAQDAAAKIELDKEQKQQLKNTFPSNAHKKEEEPKEEIKEVKTVKKVITGTVVKRKKPLGKRFMETFISDDIVNVKSYIIHDILVPAAKDTVADIAQGIMDAFRSGLEVALFGEERSSRNRKSGNRKEYVSYNSMSSRDKDKRDDRRDISTKNRARHNFDDIIFNTRGEAEEVRSHLVDLIIDYGVASVADLYDLVGITGSFTDNKYGWEDLSTARISRSGGGYVIVLPKAILLD